MNEIMYFRSKRHVLRAIIVVFFFFKQLFKDYNIYT